MDKNVKTKCKDVKVKSKKFALVLLTATFLLLTTTCFFQLLPAVTPASATSNDNLLSANIASILALSTDSCTADPANTVVINITPLPTGNTQSNNCQTVGITTNASGGYTLGMHTSDITLQHNPVLTPQQTIPSISATGNNVAVLTSNTWGYAIPKTNNDGNQPNASKLLTTAFITNFDDTYSQETNLASSTSVYRRAPTTSTLFARTNTYSSSTDEYRLYFAANVPAIKTAGIYQTTIVYTGTALDTTPVYPTITVVVPDLASTIAPTSDGLNPGPQFSFYGTNLHTIPAGAITIGGNPCKELTVNSAGTAATCTGPTQGLSAGVKPVSVWGIAQTPTVTYDATNYPTLQSLTGGSGTCQGTATTPVIYRDARDSQLYYVAKLADNKCWMLDNLKYKPNGDTTGTVTPGFTAEQQANTGTYLTVDGTADNTSPNSDVALYIDPIPAVGGYCYNNTNKPAENITKCGLLYNWQTTTAGTAPQTSYFFGQPNAVGSICPANWRLPNGGGTTSVQIGDFAVLETAAGGPGTSQTPPLQPQIDLWWPNGSWRGVFSGYYRAIVELHSAYGWYWSSSVASVSNGSQLRFSSSNVYPGTTTAARYNGLAVRCVL